MFSKHCKNKRNSFNLYFLYVIYLWVSTVKVSRAQFQIPDDDKPERLLPCHIPTGRASFCVPTNRCDQISALISNLRKPIPTDTSKYIKDMFVCPGGKTVCCPFNSISNPKPEKRPPIRNKGTVFDNTDELISIIKEQVVGIVKIPSNSVHFFIQMKSVQFKMVQRLERVQFISNATHY